MSFWRLRRQAVFVAGKVVRQAIRNDGQVLGKIERGGDDEERQEQE